MAVTDFFAGEIVVELLKTLISISKKSIICKSSADQFRTTVEELLPTIEEIKYSGVELPESRQFQLDRLSETLRDGLEVSKKALHSKRWNVYKNLQLARKMEKLEKKVSRFINGPMQAHILADVHHMRFDTAERFDRIDGSARRLEERLASMKIGVGSSEWVEEAVKRVGMEEDILPEGNLMGQGLAFGKRKVKEMLIEREDLAIVEIHGIGGSGKTTLAAEVCRDDQVTSYFQDRILFLTVSQSPKIEQLKIDILNFLSRFDGVGDTITTIPRMQQIPPKTTPRRCLVVLDDVWALADLQKLICKAPGCKTLVVSRFRFHTVTNATYEVELLREDESLSLFCHSAFGQNTIPLGANQNLVKQIVNECKGLPLALKVIGASLRDQPETCWASAKKRLLRGEPIGESHESNLLDRMAISIQYLPQKVRECFLDLGSFPEDKKIPVEVLIDMWVEIHDIEAEEAFAILVELSDRNLLTLLKDPRAGDMYSSYYEIYVSQHDVLRDLALHLSNQANINDRRRLLMPKKDTDLPKEWARNVDRPFNAQIVSVHTGEMVEMDWFRMEFPKAEVLILNFDSKEYFLPPFIENMPNLRALIVINRSNSTATLRNFSISSNLTNLKSLWLERISIPQLPEGSILYLQNLRKLSLVLCKIKNILHHSMINPPLTFPRLLELTIDHSDDLTKLPPGFCQMHSLESVSITNCHCLQELPDEIHNLRSLKILRLYACPLLKTLPQGICDLTCLKYLNISQCVDLTSLPQGIGRLENLEKIDMRECFCISDLPNSISGLRSLRQVICDEDISFEWEERGILGLDVLVLERTYGIDWIRE